MDDIHDEVSSIFVSKFYLFSLNVGGIADVFVIVIGILIALYIKLSLPKHFRLQKSSRRIYGQIHSLTSIMYLLFP
jgi:hypothetical protein